jgi:hypothetical protein
MKSNKAILKLWKGKGFIANWVKDKQALEAMKDCQIELLDELSRRFLKNNNIEDSTFEIWKELKEEIDYK